MGINPHKPDWNGQNIPKEIKEFNGSSFFIIPMMEIFLEYDENTIVQLAPKPLWSINWGPPPSQMDNDFYLLDHILDVVPDFFRYGCIQATFPTTDLKKRKLTEQGQVDRFLFLVDMVYGGLPKNHREVNHRGLVEALIKLATDNYSELEFEESEGVEWELASEK